VSEVLAAITRHGEATTYRGNQVVLVGGSVLLTPKTAEMALALLVNRIGRVSQRCCTMRRCPRAARD